MVTGMTDHNGESIPIVELRIRAMGEHIISHVALMADDIAARVAEQVKHTVDAFDFESYVRSETEQFLRGYVTDGAGGEAIRDLAAKLGEDALTHILRGKTK